MHGYVSSVVRWNTMRSPLFVSALAALILAGCGASARRPGNSLHAAAERSLLRLVARARTDFSAGHGTAAHAVLGQFVAEVRTLHGSGQLSRTIAGRLDRQAHLTVIQIPRQTPAANPASQASTVSAPTTPAAATVTPPSVPTPSPVAGGQPSTARGPGRGGPGRGHDQPTGPSQFTHGHGDDRRGRGPRDAPRGGGND